MEWQPIETAPKDGTKVLLACPNSIFIALWCSSAYFLDDSRCRWYIPDTDPVGCVFKGEEIVRYNYCFTTTATHWMPLPELPK
jgi:hypothetical protein